MASSLAETRAPGSWRYLPSKEYALFGPLHVPTGTYMDTHTHAYIIQDSEILMKDQPKNRPKQI